MLKYFQLDMRAPNLAAGKRLIDTFDGFRGPFSTLFFHQRLGPDGRIYMTANNGVYYLHRLHYPNLPGKACQFRQHDLQLPAHHAFSTPNFPFFRLGPLDGSPCDTLGLNNVPVANFMMDTPDSSDLQTRYFYNLAHHEPATWRWDFGDGSPTSTDTSALHNYALPGKYRVCLTVTNQYGTDTYCREVYVGVVAAAEAPPATEILQLLPNPAGEVTTLYIADPSAVRSARLFITDAFGRIMLSQPLRGQLTELAVGGWAPGVYFVKVERGGGVPALAGKLVVAR